MTSLLRTLSPESWVGESKRKLNFEEILFPFRRGQRSADVMRGLTICLRVLVAFNYARWGSFHSRRNSRRVFVTEESSKLYLMVCWLVYTRLVYVKSRTWMRSRFFLFFNRVNTESFREAADKATKLRLAVGDTISPKSAINWRATSSHLQLLGSHRQHKLNVNLGALIEASLAIRIVRQTIRSERGGERRKHFFSFTNCKLFMESLRSFEFFRSCYHRADGREHRAKVTGVWTTPRVVGPQRWGKNCEFFL